MANASIKFTQVLSFTGVKGGYLGLVDLEYFATIVIMNLVNRKLEILCVVAFVVVNLVGPMVVGEIYPFTISPMFSDQPNEYCVYEVFDENGQPIDSELFGLHLVYDGNPPGLGMGIQAQPTLHGFGETATVDQLRSHVKKKLAKMPERQFVTVKQCLVRCVDHCPTEAVVELKVERLADATESQE